ncbi:putative RNA exonuclease pqe-1 isoform X2 [Eupeodes corollae]|uniref:putative RNA exonuclease pqe-1 isoform X2 n=1 Tax=Eupeodes corollae TaxID=290404 RepID=UPI002490409C|nr:putative RNA exonuclease pqe-1 isoform X2 [Eupeodes corollae]
MDHMDITSSAMIIVPVIALCIAAFFALRRTKNDTLQRDRSKASHSTQRKNEKDTKHDNNSNKTDGLLTSKCQKHKSVKNVQKQNRNQKLHHHHHHSENNHNNNYQKKTTSTTRANDKEFDTLLTTKLNGIRDMNFTSNGEYFASGTEESIINRHNPTHRNSTASDVASTSDEVNSVSSHEDLSDTYDLVKVNKKTARARRNRKQRRQQQQQLQEQQSLPDQQQQQQTQQQQTHQQQQSASTHQKKQNKNISNSSSSIASSSSLSLSSSSSLSSSPPSTPNSLFQQQKLSKSSRRNGKNNNNNHNTATAQQHPLSKTAKNLLHCSETPSSSATNSVSSSPTASPKAKRIGKIRHLFESPLSLVDVLSEYEIASYLRQYVPDAKKLRNFGYPVESTVYEGCIEIYKSVPSFFPPRATATTRHHHPVGVVNSTDGLRSFTSPNRKLSSGDSGKGSGTSTPLSYNASPADSDYSEEENTADMIYSQVVEKNCVRCRKPFKVTTSGEFITREPCNYHWGKQEAGEYMDEKGDSTSITFFSCCKKVPPEPCTQNHVHVWTDITSGLNGPYTDFVHTEPRRRLSKIGSTDDDVKIYALDCEMSYTGFGMEVTKVTVVSYNGTPVYESIVHPRSEVGDYNTRFSGVSEKDFAPGSEARTLETVQNDLLDLIDADDILIGHALENDLRSLRIVHKRIVDTAIIYPHPNGFPFRRGLKSIVTAELGREIQVDEAGHSSLEDSLACLELMLLKVRSDWRAKSTKKAKSETQPIIPKSEQFVVISQHQSALKA